MRGYSKRKILILPLIILMALFAFESQEMITLADTPWASQPSGPYIPHIRGGFTSQPYNKGKENPLKKGDEIDLNASFHLANNYLYRGLKSNYVWYESIDNGAWNTVSVSENSPELKKKMSNFGNYRFQLEHYFYWYPDTNNRTSDFYSDVVSIDVGEPAKSATVSFDRGYLLNAPNSDYLGKTFAHIKFDAASSTHPVTWRTSNKSLATIDANSGEITANSKKQSGTVTIIATVDNGNSNTITASKKLEIGGGLIDQNIREGDDATFPLIPLYKEKLDPNITIDWVQVTPKNPHGIHMPTPKNPYIYEIEHAMRNHNGESYYAIISLGKNHSNSYITNKANLNVIVPYNPKVSIDNSITNVSDSQSNNNTINTVNDVKQDDEILYNILLANHGYQAFSKASANLDIPIGAKVSKVTINGKEISSDQYILKPDSIKKKQHLSIKLKQFNVDEKLSIEITTKIGNIEDGTSLVTTPSFDGVANISPFNQGKNYQTSGPHPNTINFYHKISDEFTPYIKNIQFEPIIPARKNVLDYRTSATNAPNNIATFDDKRSRKSHLYVYLKESAPLGNLKNKIDGQLMYYEKGQSPKSIKDKVLLESSEDGQALTSIKWDRNSGLLLHLNSSNLPQGSYTTSLTWTIQNSIG